MPVIKIYGLPKKMNGQSFKRELRCAVTSIKELELTDREVTIFFPSDMMPRSGEEIVVFIEGLFVKPRRTKGVRNRLAQVLGETIDERFSNALIEVFVQPFNPAQGFWTSGPKAPANVYRAVRQFERQFPRASFECLDHH